MLCFGACSQECTEDVIPADGEGVTLKLEVEQGVKSVFDQSTWGVSFESGDKVEINGQTVNVRMVQGEPEFTISKADTYTAVFAGDHSSSLTTGGHYTMPAEQSYRAGSFDSTALPMLAYLKATDGTTLQFKAIAGVLRLGLTGTDTITRIEVASADGVALSGKMTLDAEAATATHLVPAADGTSTAVALDCAEGVKLSTTAETYFYIVVPAGAHANGVKVTVHDNAGGSNLYTSKAVTFVQGIVQTTDPITYAPAFSAPVYGQVCTVEGNPVANAVVSDGINVVKTNTAGYYALETDVYSGGQKFVLLSIPSGYEAVASEYAGTRTEGNAFWSAIEGDREGQRHDFTLKAVDQTNYTLITMADSHVVGDSNSYHAKGSITTYRNSVLPVITNHIGSVKSASNPVYAIHLGDMTQTEDWSSYSLNDHKTDMATLGVPVFNCIGNHDHDRSFLEKDKSTTWESILGPTYYSFNIGRRHFIVLDNIYMFGYQSADISNRLTDEQLAWVKSDFAALDKTNIDEIVLVAHTKITGGDKQAIFGMDTSGTAVENNGSKDRRAFYDIFNGYKVTIFSGHYHKDWINKIDPNGEACRILEYTEPAISGTSWYTTDYLRDGTPAAFVSYTCQGSNEMVRAIHPWKDSTLKYRLYNTSDITDQSGTASVDGTDATSDTKAIMVNAWGAWSCEFTSGGETTTIIGKDVSTKRHDLAHRNWYKDNESSLQDGHKTQTSTHIWSYSPTNVDDQITVTAKDYYGRVLATFTTRVGAGQ